MMEVELEGWEMVEAGEPVLLVFVEGVLFEEGHGRLAKMVG